MGKEKKKTSTVFFFLTKLIFKENDIKVKIILFMSLLFLLLLCNKLSTKQFLHTKMMSLCSIRKHKLHF